MGEFPPSSDVVELRALNGRVVLRCLICDEDIGTATYLNEAIVVWRSHRSARAELSG